MNRSFPVVFSAAAIAAAGLLSAPTAATTADPAPIVVPADATPAAQTDSIVVAAASGFLHRRIAGAPLLWTR